VTVEAKIQLLVQDFVTNVTALARQVAVDTLANALNATTASASPTRRQRLSAAGGSTRAVGLAKGRKRPAGDLERLSARLLDHVKANPGQRIEQINRALGTRTPELRGPVVKLIATKEIKTKGQRRATTYFAA
jgi:hypothetical protein